MKQGNREERHNSRLFLFRNKTSEVSDGESTVSPYCHKSINILFSQHNSMNTRILLHVQIGKLVLPEPLEKLEAKINGKSPFEGS